MLSLLQSAPATFALVAGALLYSLALHELAHAWTADKMGDKTARNLGRITLNPLRHLDPVGTAMLFLVGFGWARPVPIQPGNFRHYRVGMLVVSLAGVIVNLLLALAALGALAGLGVTLGTLSQALARDPLRAGLFFMAQINIVLATFNLLPVPPLDGSKALQALLPRGMQRALWGLERYGFLLVVILLVGFREQVFGLINGVTLALLRLVLA
ncbi:site-2 protease family protein [Truepera radiovictrix]|uniref:Peptidase M50 n=1 Tax=Truepera radiovictrix (strain DSM 17093 / CIP 108686 / LMG 22925 / RQ-24) TaxID=649638 RepID=D7CTN2_TRURR|nr:site-2 protease family protein [Truepera radiovictrix]ADI13889.1 peptidase M50 [Truepera radiovictrix DSM 17093]WMT57547.1 site-2 protease family protein [Truepera radiovictrix]